MGFRERELDRGSLLLVCIGGAFDAGDCIIFDGGRVSSFFLVPNLELEDCNSVFLPAGMS